LWWFLGGGASGQAGGGGFEVWGAERSEVVVGVMGGAPVLLILGIRHVDIVRDQSSFC